MALPTRKAGGGYLNGIAGIIVAAFYRATVWNEGKDNEYTTLSIEIQVLQDGATAPVKQFLPAGFIYENHIISEDGLSISDTEGDDRTILQDDTYAIRFIQSAIDAGLPEAPFVESGLRSLSGLVNQRYRFKRVTDEAATAEFGKRKYETKDGKKGEAPRDYLVVSEYLGVVEPAKKGSKVAAPKAAAAKATSKPAAAPKPAADDAQANLGVDVLLSILADNSPIERNAISAKIVKYSTENQFSESAEEHKAIREALRKLVGSEDFLNQTGKGWTYDAKAKGQPVSLA